MHFGFGEIVSSGRPGITQSARMYFLMHVWDHAPDVLESLRGAPLKTLVLAKLDPDQLRCSMYRPYYVALIGKLIVFLR